MLKNPHLIRVFLFLPLFAILGLMTDKNCQQRWQRIRTCLARAFFVLQNMIRCNFPKWCKFKCLPLCSLGRAIRVRTNDNNNGRLSDLAKLALKAGFDWVHYKDRDYIHISVIPDGRLFYNFFIFLFKKLYKLVLSISTVLKRKAVKLCC